MAVSLSSLRKSRTDLVRPLEPGDLPAVARLFQQTFGSRATLTPPSLQTYLGQVFLEHPWRDPDLISRVHLSNDGAVNGFLGILPLRMDFRGRKIRAAVASSFMVDKPKANPHAGLNLFRTFMAGAQDLSLVETARPVAQRMWTAARGQTSPLCSMEWIRVLDPASTCVSLIAGPVPAFNLLRPFAMAADCALKRFAFNPFRLAAAKGALDIHDVEVDEDVFIGHALRFVSVLELHPDWDAQALRFILSHAARKERYGTLTCRLIYANGPDPIGGYIYYYCRPGGVAWVLQIFSDGKHAGAILDSLFVRAREQGAVAIRGRTNPSLMESLILHNCLFFHRSTMLVRSREPALLEAALSGNGLITGMAGESCDRLIGGIFQ